MVVFFGWERDWTSQCVSTGGARGVARGIYIELPPFDNRRCAKANVIVRSRTHSHGPHPVGIAIPFRRFVRMVHLMAPITFRGCTGTPSRGGEGTRRFDGVLRYETLTEDIVHVVGQAVVLGGSSLRCGELAGELVLHGVPPRA